ncbi:MAG: protein kinase [Rhodopirellula sp. JB044]|uniref:protein kinase n=1 Tax=Rhodopirellula sp. JB044 TaxID=3342844 RepID=UPI003709ED48
MNRRVLKIGGSLLLRSDLLGDLRTWWLQQPPAFNVAIAGGGEMINAIRAWDRLRPGSPAHVHWRCVEMLRFSFESLRDAFLSDPRWPEFRAVDDSSAWERTRSQLAVTGTPGAASTATMHLCNVPAIYQRSTSIGSPTTLPESWDTTTDAIALWIAQQVEADECVLLKSCAVPANASLSELIQEGIVDEACSLFENTNMTIRVEPLPGNDGIR